MNNFDIAFIVEATGGKRVFGEGNFCIKKFCIDSREAEPESLFIPIIGENKDAHDFIPDVFAAGCRVTLTSQKEPDFIEGMNYILVEDTRKALQDIAALHRKRIRIPLIGITGSVGKTTSKEMLALALGAGKKVFKTPANHNSQIGVPLTLLSIDEEPEIGVIEMGVSQPGEMSKIAALVQPDSVLITNIGTSHIMLLGSREGIRDEKFRIMEGMKEGSAVFLNKDDDILSSSQVYPTLKPIFFSRKEESDTDVFASEISQDSGLYTFTAEVFKKRVRTELNVYGIHQINNALAALAVAAYYGVDIDKAAKRLASFDGFKHRQQILKKDGVRVIDDTYNASPESMRAALHILKDMECKGRKIAVLADMKELGKEEKNLHAGIGKEIEENKLADIVLTYGELASYIGEQCRSTYHFNDIKEIEDWIRESSKEGDVILYKGSNSMRLFDIVDRLYR